MRLVALTAGSLLALASCATTRLGRSANPAVVAADEPALKIVSDWEFAGRAGRIIQTEHYRIHTTSDNSELVERFSDFMESALEHYRSAITDLPAPRRAMDSYIFDNRREWIAFTEQLMDKQAPKYTRIRRGGYATGGRAVFWDIGLYDTMAIAAHEGWHQYTQRTFRDRLPIWLEEGLGTYMEGHRWYGRSVTFNAWINPERFDQLRVAKYQGRLKSVRQILTLKPENLLGQASSDVLDFYAQVWALSHFLHEGSNGKYSQQLEKLLNDAGAGRIRARLEQALRQHPPVDTENREEALATIFFTTYFGNDLDAIDLEYQSFINTVVASGSRQLMLQGKSPIAPQNRAAGRGAP